MPRFDQAKARAAQERLSSMVVEEPLTGPIKAVCGMDVSYRGEDGAGAAVVISFPGLNILEKKTVLQRAPLPYISTFLAFREMLYFSRLFRTLETRPDLFMINGHGLFHPAFLGSASHFGVIFNAPTIGVAKNPLNLEGMERHGGTIYVRGRRVGFVIGEPRDKLYVSVGHRITLEQAVEVVAKCSKGHRLPEPLFLAHSLSRDALSVI
jgi:deoxyribonuclease V